MSQALHLYRLQKVDSQRDHAVNRIKSIDKILSENQTLLYAQRDKDNAGHELRDANLSLKKAEDQVSDQTIKIEEVEATLYGGKVRSPKELQDLQNELQSLKRFLTTLEDRQLDAMVHCEEQEEKLNQAGRKLQEIEAKLAGDHSALRTERTRLEHDLIRLEAERKEILTIVQAPNLQIYEKIRIQRGGVAVAEISDDSCSACGSPVTPAEWQAARSPAKLVTCSSCGRILYGG